MALELRSGRHGDACGGRRPRGRLALVSEARKQVPSASPVRLARDVLAGDRISEDDSARGDVEFADFGLVGAAARLEDRHGAQQSWFGAQVLQQDDVVGEVRDAVFGQAADVEEVGYFAGHDWAYARAREALHERVDELAEADGIGGRVLQVAEAVDQ